MLFVNHDDAERAEFDAFLDERMSTNGDVNRSIGQARQNLAAPSHGDPIGQQFDTHGTIAEQVVGVANDEPV